MGRTNPLSLRVGGLINWPSTISHPFLVNYIRHIFQESLIGEPGIRSSPKELYVNLTILGDSITSHPKFRDPFLSFKDVDLNSSLSRLESRLQKLTVGHYYFKDLFKDIPKTLIEANQLKYGNQGALQLFTDKPVHLRINVIKNPLLNAEVCADWVARSLKQDKSLALIYKQLLANMG